MLGLAIACAVSAAAWVYLVAAQGASGGPDSGCRFGGRPRQPPATTVGRRWSAVSLQARNEADSLPTSLPSLLAQGYPGEFRVFLVDDGSDDGTAAVAAELGEKAARDGGAPLTIMPGHPEAGRLGPARSGRCPRAWPPRSTPASSEPGRVLGGSAAARVAPRPAYVLFTDADITWAPTALRNLVRAAEDDDRALVSQMALLRAETAWERVIVPAFVYFFAQLYPFRKVNNPGAVPRPGRAGTC